MSAVYGVLVKMDGAQRAKWLTPSIGLTTKRIHAWQFPHQDNAERVATELLEENGDKVGEAKVAVLR